MTTTSSALGRLSDCVQGPLFLPDDPAVADELHGFNSAAVHRPAVVVGATDAHDVAAAVRYARDSDRPVAVHATGHSGTSYVDAVVISTRRMSRVTVDPVARRARVSAGARWQQVLDAACPHGLAPLSGSSPSVGVIGYTVGGGVGPIARTFGFAADHVRSADVVTADGAIRTVSSDREPDLFWAIRGGKGNFGVVTSMEFDLMPVAHLYAGGIFFAGQHAPAVLDAYVRWTGGLSERTTSSLALLRLPDAPQVPEPLRGRCSVHLRFAHVGDVDEAIRVLAPMRSAAPALLDAVRDMPYSDIGSVHNDPPGPLPSWSTGAFLTSFTTGAAQRLLEVAGPQHELPLILVELRHLGGALSRQPGQPNACGGRDAGFLLGVVGPYAAELAEVVPAAGHGVVTVLAPWANGQVPVNYLDTPDPGQPVGQAWPRPVYKRLLDTKAHYDPTDTFRVGYTLGRQT